MFPLCICEMHVIIIDLIMIGQDSREVERKAISILRALSESPQPLGARLIAHKLKEYDERTEKIVKKSKKPKKSFVNASKGFIKRA